MNINHAIRFIDEHGVWGLLKEIQFEDGVYWAAKATPKFAVVPLTIPTQKWSYTGHYGFVMGVLRFTRGALMP